MAREVDHAQLLESAQRERAEQRLGWLREPASAAREAPARERLFSPEGEESLEQAVREHRYSSAEWQFLPRQLGELARAAVLEDGQKHMTEWLATRLAIGSEAKLPAELLTWLADPAHQDHGATALLRALDGGLAKHASFYVDLQQRADFACAEQLRAAKRFDLPVVETEPEPAGRAKLTQQDVVTPASTTGQRAAAWLEGTDDAMRELTGWFIKRAHMAGATGESELGTLITALRAKQFDGLARPQRRLQRLAEGARRLGFDRDMGARMRALTADPQLLPLPNCVAVAVPEAVRVVQSSLDYGVLSELAGAQSIGEALALALVSPSVGPVLARPLGHTVSAAFGGMFLQLRAEPDYLRRVDGLDREPSRQMARHVALWIMLRVRLAAAFAYAMEQPARSSEERISQLMAAAERALGRELPAGVVALGLITHERYGQTFEAIARGCELHAALRERYDTDFYLNPRVSEVLRGAAARGNQLDAAGFVRELRPRVDTTAAGIARLIELLG